MANFSELKAAIQTVIKQNGNKEITGTILQGALLSMINSIGKYSTFAGGVTTSFVPGSEDGNVFYIPTQSGVYTNMGGISVDLENEFVLIEKKTTNFVKISIPMRLSELLKKNTIKRQSVGGKNLAFKGNIVNDKIVKSYGIISESNGSKYIEFDIIDPGNYTISGMIAANNKYLAFLNNEGVVIGSTITISTIPKTVSVPTGTKKVRFTIKVPTETGDLGFEFLQFEKGVVATAYETPIVYISEIDGAKVMLPNDEVIAELRKKINDISDMASIPGNSLIPRDKTAESYGSPGGINTVYGFSDTFFSPFNLEKIFINSKGAGNYLIEFRSETNEIIYTYNGISTGVGIIELTKTQLNFPDAINKHPKIFPFVGNKQTATENVFMYGTNNPNARIWWLANVGSQNTTEYNTNASFNFWLQVKNEYQIVSEIRYLKTLIENIPPATGLQFYNYQDNKPILPKHLFIVDERTTQLYRKSMFSKYKNELLPEIMLVSNGNKIDIGEPTNIKITDVGNTGRLVVNKNTDVGDILYKDISIIKATLADKVGETVTVMSLGDSLTEGGAGFNSSPIYLLTQQLQSLGITVQGVGTIQRTSGSITQQYEGRGGWRYRTFVGLEPKFSSLNVTLPSLSKPVWIEGTDGNINTIKANNVFLYPATTQDLIDYPEWCFNFVIGGTTNNVRYSENPNLGTYYIFDPARYLLERGKTAPDILTIALGTNEWYLAGFSGWDLPLISSCVDWMITRFRQAMPTTKIVVIPCNNFPLSRETEWQEKASLLTSEVLKICENKISNGDSNLFTLSIFAQGSRVLAYDTITNETNLSENNTTKVAVINSDVHMLNTADSSREDYINALTDCVICLS